jgi:hypothetical protein
MNSEKWTGNYATKGVTNIRFEARNASTSNPLYFRVAIGDSLNPMSGTWFVSDSLSLLNYNDGWTSIHLDINANSMVKASSAMMNGSPGPGSFNDVFTNVVAIRIISQSSAFSAVAQNHYGDVYIDSVALIPEPHTVGFITISSLILAMRRNSHKKKHPHLRSQTHTFLVSKIDSRQKTTDSSIFSYSEKSHTASIKELSNPACIKIYANHRP